MTAALRLSPGPAFALALCLSLVATAGAAAVASQTLTELRAASDLIATGTLTSERTDPAPELGGMEIRRLRLDRVLVGTAPETVPLATPGPDAPVSSSDIRYPDGATGLWFLRTRPASTGPVYLADSPQRFVPAAEAGAVIRALDAAEAD